MAIVIKNFKKSKYKVAFDTLNGTLIRKGYGDSEPFMKQEGPELLDVSITNYCDKGCSYCYKKSYSSGIHMPIENYKKLLYQAKTAKVIQIAIGGGNPNQHPDFIEILRITREYGIVPSYTSNGIGLTPDIIEATKKYCGAVAISLHKPYNIAYQAIDKCLNAGIKTNIHFILSNSSINEAIAFLRDPLLLPKCLNAIIFLNYKPVEENDTNLLNLADQEKINTFFNLVNINKYPFKVGFDSCLISYILKYVEDFEIAYLDYCEAGRFSAYISETMKMLPCSFMESKFIGADILQKDIEEIWNNEHLFLQMRNNINTLKDRCKLCKHHVNCCGGCNFYDINDISCE
jgi:radical SAM additional 4Fe4S-binding domain